MTISPVVKMEFNICTLFKMVNKHLTSNIYKLYARSLGLETYFFDNYVSQFLQLLCRAKRKPFYTDRLCVIIKQVSTSVSSTPLIIGVGLKKIRNLFYVMIMKTYVLIASFIAIIACKNDNQDQFNCHTQVCFVHLSSEVQDV